MSNSFSRETLIQMWNGVETDSQRLQILFQISLDTAERVVDLETGFKENFQKRGVLDSLATILGRIGIWRS